MANDVGRNGHSRQEIDPSTYPEEFVLQLNTEDFPMELAGRLLQYLSMQTFNAGDAFEFRYSAATDFCVTSTRKLEPNAEVFLIDHAVTFTNPEELASLFQTHPGLMERLCGLFSILPPIRPEAPTPEGDEEMTDLPETKPKIEGAKDTVLALMERLGSPYLSEMDSIKTLDAEDMGLSDDSLPYLAKLFYNLEVLKLGKNHISSMSAVIQLCTTLSDLKVLDLSGNPVCESESYPADLPKTVELVDGKARGQLTGFIYKYASGNDENSTELNLRDYDLSTIAKDAFLEGVTPSLRVIDLRGNPRLTEADLRIVSECIEMRSVRLDDLKVDPEVGLYDSLPKIFPSVRTINGTPPWLIGKSDESRTSILLEKIFSALPRYTMQYQMARPESPQNRIAIFYVMDEVGSRVKHSAQPNCRLMRIFFDGQAFSVLWPIKVIETGEIITRDFAYGVTDPEERKEILESYDLKD